VLLSLLVAIGAVGLLRDVRKPYKTEGDEQARQFVRTVLERTGGEPIVLLDAPPRLYPSLEWYLRLEGGEVTRARSLEDLPLDAATKAFWCLRFRTNDAPQDVLPPFWNGSHGVFALRARACFLLGLGTEPDDTHSCEVSQWARVAGGRSAEMAEKETGP